MHSEKPLLDLHGLFWWAKRTRGSTNMLRFIGAFQSCFEVLCSVAKAGISSCLISLPTNFNITTASHQHTKHVDPPNQTHLKHNIPELMHSDFLFSNFYLHRLITLIFPLSLKLGARRPMGNHTSPDIIMISILWYIFNYTGFVISFNNVMKRPGAPLLHYWSR